MGKLKKTITAYINENLKHDDQFKDISRKLNLQKTQKRENYNFMKSSRIWKIVLPCLVLLLVVVGIVLLGNSNPSIEKDPAAVIQMDVNPSISFVIDEDEVVLSVYGENDEGKMIINGEEIVGLKLNVAIEKIVSLESQTGYLVKGNVSNEENTISFSIEADSEEIVNQLQQSLQTSVSNICEELKINETLNIVKTNTKAPLVQRALKIDPSLTEAKANEMTIKELLAYIQGCHLEKINLPTEQIEELYNRVKVQKIQLVEREETKAVIDKLDSTYQTLKNNYQSLYQGLIEAQNALNEAYVKYFINEDSVYQQALLEYQNQKLEVLQLENEISQMENSIEKTLKQGVLEGKKLVLDTLLKALEGAKVTANSAVELISDTIDKVLENMDEFYNQLPTEIKTQVNDNLSNLENKINVAKDKIFEDFETNYKAQIESAYSNAKSYKENLIEQLKNGN